MREPKQNNNKGEETTPEPSLFQIASYVARKLRAALDADLRVWLIAAAQVEKWQRRQRDGDARAVIQKHPAHQFLDQCGGAQ